MLGIERRAPEDSGEKLGKIIRMLAYEVSARAYSVLGKRLAELTAHRTVQPSHCLHLRVFPAQPHIITCSLGCASDIPGATLETRP